MRGTYIIIALILVLVFGSLLYLRGEKKEFVTSRAIESLKNPLFIYDIVKYSTKVEVVEEESPKIGMACDPSGLNFGTLPIGFKGHRYINLTNPGENVFRIKMIAYGNISEMISFDKNDLELNPGEELEVTVFLNTSHSILGNYTGEINVISKRAKYPFFDWLTEWI